MIAIRAHVVNGQIVLDEPMNLPEGAAAEVHLLDDAVTVAERDEIEKAVDEGAEDFARGDFVDARALALKLVRVARSNTATSSNVSAETELPVC